MRTKTSLLASVSFVVILSASASFAEGTTPASEMAKAEIVTVAAPAAETPKMPTTVVDPQTGQKVELAPTSVPPAPALQAAAKPEPATTGSTARAATLVAAKPDKAAQCAVLIKQRDTATNPVDGVQAINAMAKLGGCPSSKPSTADKGKAAAKPRTATPAVAPVNKPAPVNAAKMKVEYASANAVKPTFDPLTAGIPVVERFNPLSFAVYGSVGAGGAKASGYKAETSAFGRLGADVSYRFNNAFGVFAGAFAGFDGNKLSFSQDITVLQAQKFPLGPLRRTLSISEEIETAYNVGARLGAFYRVTEQFEVGGYAIAQMSKFDYAFSSTLSGVGPIPAQNLGSVNVSKTVFLPGVGGYVRYYLPNSPVYLGVNAEYIGGKSIDFSGTTVKLDASYRVMGEVGLKF